MNHQPTQFDTPTIMRAAPHLLAHWASGGKWQPYRHLRYVSTVLATEMQKPGARILINMPPRVGKTSLAAKWLPIWYLDRWPDRNVLLCGHGADLGAACGRAIRNEIEQSQLLRVRLSDDSTAADHWHTPQGGGMKTGGVGSGITGFGGNLQILDDPYPTWAAAHSYTYREKLLDWWHGTFIDRAEQGAAIVVMHHRWHVEDLSGVLLNGPDAKRWVHIRLPAFAEPGDPLGRKPGEELCPERFSKAEWENTAVALGEARWAAKYQQAPKAGGVGVVYSAFDEAHICPALEFVPGLPLCVCMDFNINPGMHALVGQYDRQVDDFRFVWEIHAEGMALDACLNELRRLAEREWGGWKWPRVEVYADASGGSRQINTGQSALALIQQRLALWGVKATLLVPAANPPVSDRVAAMNDALLDGRGQRHVRIHPRCVRLLRDLRELRLGEKGEISKAAAALSHASDAASYWVSFSRPAGGRIDIPRGRFGVR